MADQTIDCKKLKCPMPIVKTSKAIKKMESGQTLEVEATDPAFKKDLEAWSNKLGHKIIEFSDGDIKKAIIRKT